MTESNAPLNPETHTESLFARHLPHSDFLLAPSVTAVLRAHAASHPEREAVSFVHAPGRENGAVSLSYHQLDRESQKIAASLQSRFSFGDRVLLLYPVGLEFVAAFLGCLYSGMVAVPAPLPGQHPHQRHRVKAIALDADISACLTDAANLPLVLDWAKAEGLDRIPCLAGDTEVIAPAESWSQPSLHRQTLALLQYTSGSTGDPKGVMITHDNLLYNAASFCAALGFTRTTRFGGWIPLYHDMGLMAQLLPALLLGSACVLMSPLTFLKRPYQWLQMLDKHDVHVSAAPNFAFDLCRRKVTAEQLAQLDLSRWRYALNGSEPVQAATLRAFAEQFAAAGFDEQFLCPCYGMAEATVFVSGFGPRPPVIQRVSARRLEKNEFKPAISGEMERSVVCCGRPLGHDVCIVHPETLKALAEGDIGEIWLRGRSISQGYWRNASASAGAFQAHTSDGDGPFLRTGDLGLLYQGEIYVTGRIKEILIIHGRNHYPQDMEHEIRSRHPELSGKFGAIFSVPLREGEEVAVVTHEIHNAVDRDRLQDIASNIRTSLSQAFGVRVAGVSLLRTGGVLRTTSGKVQRSAMRERFLKNALPSLYENLDPELYGVRETSHPGLAGFDRESELVTE